MQAGAPADAGSVLHSIKGVALNTGAQRLAEAADDLYRRLRAGDARADDAGDLDALDALAARSLAALDAWAGGLTKSA